MAGIGSVGLTEMTFVTGQPVLAQLEAVVRRVKDECFLECTCALQQVDHLAQVVVQRVVLRPGAATRHAASSLRS